MSLKKAIVYYIGLSAGKVFPVFHCFGMVPPVIIFCPIPHLPGQKRNVWTNVEQTCLLSVSELVSGKSAEVYDRKLFLTFIPLLQLL